MIRKISCFIVCMVVFFTACSQVPNAGSDTQSAVTSAEENNTLTTRVPQKKVFSQEKTYRETLSNVHTIEDIACILSKNSTVDSGAIDARGYPMILKEQFFLVPSLEGSTISGITLTGGRSEFMLYLPDNCKLEINVYHSNADFSLQEGTSFTIYDGISVIHRHHESQTNHLRESYYMQVEGYWVTIHGYSLCGCKQSYIKNLTFEKVEIK